MIVCGIRVDGGRKYPLLERMIREHHLELAPFRERFQKGSPALLYHRLGGAGLFTKWRGLAREP